jgi:hypothetical protein
MFKLHQTSAILKIFRNWLMIYQQIIDAIILKLNDGGYSKEASELKEVSSSAYMSQTELLGEVSLSVQALVKHNKEIMSLISKELNDLKKYCQYIGLIVW